MNTRMFITELVAFTGAVALGLTGHNPALAEVAGTDEMPTTTDAAGFTFAGVADYDGDGYQDIVARDPAGLLWLYPGEGTRAPSRQPRVQLGYGWNGFTFAGVADYDGDGHQDIVARDGAGVLWLYPGDGTRAPSTQPRARIGYGWNGFTFAGVADYDGDGYQDILARDGAGLLWLYPGAGTRAPSRQPRVQLGYGWNGFTFAGVADYDGDGYQDILARDGASLLWLYPGEGRRGPSRQPRVQLGFGWSGFTFAGVADYDGDGHPDIMARDSAGLLWLYPGAGTRAPSSELRVRLGYGW